MDLESKDHLVLYVLSSKAKSIVDTKPISTRILKTNALPVIKGKSIV
jgi:hypothetical protein